ncbi:uncharacterized protein B0H18DRAFT_420235 [Fomitopsis serialis]|uniref:uncharacterized protein n=1 Tax=Fomitopsis serialis TaxID=139415 RepID=UPI002007E93D|nr:uncharacterized protein B0H18DRAFT_420235 [Neoantrodia serialis]KAH9935679.1 hypothetical protein B0H18DRAFT_420235 [Neoantrodia serialis]
MSEYWVAHKKYFCKYCNIYIADDAPSRRQHETGLRHKGNVERFVRGLYKEGERRKHDSEEEKREMARVEQAAQAAYARDVGAGLVKPGSSSTSVAARPTPEAKKPVPRPSNPYADYTTAESLGITDPDEERRKAEAERRRTQGVAGDWEVITIVESSAEPEAGAVHAGAAVPEPGPSTGMKREAEAIPDNEDTRTFKLRRRTVGVGLGEIYDPGTIPIKVKKKEEPADEALPGAAAENGPAAIGTWTAVGAGSTIATEKPSWFARGWNRPGESKANEPPNSELAAPSGESTVAREGQAEPVEIEPTMTTIAKEEPLAVDDVAAKVEIKAEEAPVKPEADASPAGGGMFRKRKLPAGGAGSRGKRT